MLRLSGIVAGYGGGAVLQGVDIACDTGSITCVVGPNGAGKSTVLRVVSGLLTPSEGTVTLHDQTLSGRSAAHILRAGVTQVPQSHALFPQMSVRENVLMGGFLIRRDRKLLASRLEQVEAMVPLVADRSNQHAGNLSGGQRRMVEIARCLMLDPTVLLLDEPSLGLDPRALAAVAELINRLHSDGVTVLLVEQNVRLGLGLATDGVVMEGGKVRLTGSATEVMNHPEIASLYLGGTSAATTEAAKASDATEPDAEPTEPAAAAG
jgi:ABC-type branched-subunit amino acid transport system ATPase component